MIRASFNEQKISPFKHSSRSLPMNDWQYPFSQGLPGSMNSGLVPSEASHFLTRSAHISARLSERTCSGTPCPTWHHLTYL